MGDETQVCRTDGLLGLHRPLEEERETTQNNRPSQIHNTIISAHGWLITDTYKL